MQPSKLPRPFSSSCPKGRSEIRDSAFEIPRKAQAAGHEFISKNPSGRLAYMKDRCPFPHFLRTPLLILSLLQFISCARSGARAELAKNQFFVEILERENSHRIGEDGFFEKNLLSNPDPEIRHWSAIALGRIGHPAALPLLYKAVHTGDAAVRAASAFAIGEIKDRTLDKRRRPPDPGAVEELRHLLDDTSIAVRMRAVEALGKIGSHKEAVEIARRLEFFAPSITPAERAYMEFSITALARLNDPAAVPVLGKYAGMDNPEIQWRALDALTRLRAKTAGALFIENLENPDPLVRSYAARGLGIMEDPRLASHLLRLLPPRREPESVPVPPAVRIRALEALGELKNPSVIPSIQAAAKADPIDEAHPGQVQFAIQAFRTLESLGSSEAASVLLSLLESGLYHHERSIRPAGTGPTTGAGITDIEQNIARPDRTLTEIFRRTLAANRKNSTIAILETNRGILEIELFRQDAPVTAAYFALMASGGFYDGMEFGPGIPLEQIETKGRRSEISPAHLIENEVHMRPFERGSLGMALEAGYSDISRFFITLEPRPYLDGMHTCFGRVISGMQVADRIVPGDRIKRVAIKETIHFHNYQKY
jgi:peptidyl-prolyl cis-trans isomerase B (cyclophilin B)